MTDYEKILELLFGAIEPSNHPIIAERFHLEADGVSFLFDVTGRLRYPTYDYCGDGTKEMEFASEDRHPVWCDCTDTKPCEEHTPGQ